MRWLFLLLLLTNVAYVAWEIGRPSDEGSVKKTSHSQIPPLILISELDSPEPLEKGREAEEAIAQSPEKEEVERDESAADKETQAADAKSKIDIPKTPPAVKTIAVSPKPLTDVCYTLGPFREINNLRAFTRAIKDYVIDVSFRSLEEKESSMFWVLLPPEGGREEALKLSKRLIQKNIKDYYIITSGIKLNGISLGHFKIKDSAYNHAKRLKKLGFKPEVLPIFETYVVYWLDIRLKQGQELPAEILDKHMKVSANKLIRECI